LPICCPSALPLRLVRGEDAAGGVDGAQGVDPVGLQGHLPERLTDRRGELAHRLVGGLPVGVERHVRHGERHADAHERVAAEGLLVGVRQAGGDDVQRERGPGAPARLDRCGSQRDARRAGLERAQLRIAVRGAFGKDRQAAAAREDGARALEGVRILGSQVGSVRVILGAVDR
jgi:hypothetical protein